MGKTIEISKSTSEKIIKINLTFRIRMASDNENRGFVREKTICGTKVGKDMKPIHIFLYNPCSEVLNTL